MEAGALLEGKRFCHGGRNRILPVCVLSSPRGEVALPSHRAGQPHSAKQSSVASSARRRAPQRRRGLLLWPTLHFPFCFTRLSGRPSVRHLDVTETAGRFTLFLPSSAALSRGALGGSRCSALLVTARLSESDGLKTNGEVALARSPRPGRCARLLSASQAHIWWSSLAVAVGWRSEKHQTTPRLWVLSRTQRPHGMFLLWLRQLVS